MSSLRLLSSPRGRRYWLPLALLPLLLIALSACGGKDKSEVTLAEVGERTITLDYFERKMNSMDPASLPPQIDTRAGREALLDIMINKEVMAIKAEELGFDRGGKSMEAADLLITMKATQLMKDELIEPYKFVSDEEAAEYYANLGRVLQVSYMVFDHEEDAIEGRKLVLGGEDWVEVARRYETGDPGPSGNWTMEVKYGTIADDVEGVVFALDLDEVSEPLDSVYGYFLFRLEGERADRGLPPFEDIQNNVARSVSQRNVTLRTVEFIGEVFEEFGFVLHEPAVRTLYLALPLDKELLPVPPQEEWGSLNLKPADMSTELMRYADEVWTLRRYHDFYEATAWLGRPRQDRNLGGLRRYLREIAVRELMPMAARERGYFDRPELLDEKKERREQVMVSELHRELIAADVEVTDKMIAEYWSENKQLYDKPVRHEGRVLISSNRESVLAAYEEAAAGADWDGLVMSYSETAKMPQTENGEYGPVAEDGENLAVPLLWADQTEGEVCEPMELAAGVWGIGRLDKILPEEEAVLAESGYRVQRVLEAQESERLFQERVGGWRSEMEIKIYPDRLDQAIYAPAVEEEVVGPGFKEDDHDGEAQS